MKEGLTFKEELEKIIKTFIKDCADMEVEQLSYDSIQKYFIEAILNLFNKRIEDIPKTELMQIFDKYRSKDKDGDIILYGVYFIDIVLDIINIIKKEVNK